MIRSSTILMNVFGKSFGASSFDTDLMNLKCFRQSTKYVYNKQKRAKISVLGFFVFEEILEYLYSKTKGESLLACFYPSSQIFV